MAKRLFRLERGGPKILLLRWGWGMRKFQVQCGPSTWNVERPALEAGSTFVLPDGSSLFVQRPKRPWFSMDSRSFLVVERDGLPVPGSDGDPRVLGRRAGGLIIIFGVFRAIAILAVLFNMRQVNEPLPAYFAVIAFEGALLLLLGVLGMFGLRLPVAIAAGLLGAEGLYLLGTSGLPNPIGVMIQTLVIVHLARLWKRMAPRQKRPSLAQVFE